MIFLLLFMIGCATTARMPTVKMEIELGTIVETVRMSYTIDATTDEEIAALGPNDVIYAVDLPKGVTAIVWVSLTGPKDTPFRIEWHFKGKKMLAMNAKLPMDMPGVQWHFWLKHPSGLPSGNYTVFIELADEFDQVDFTVK